MTLKPSDMPLNWLGKIHTLPDRDLIRTIQLQDPQTSSRSVILYMLNDMQPPLGNPSWKVDFR